MKRLILLALPFLFACGPESGDNEPLLPGNPPPIKIAEGERVLQEIKTMRTFSDQSAEDTFVISVFGRTFDAARVSFYILNAAGDTLYADRFDSKMLAVDRDTADSMPLPLYIRQEVRNFFRNDRFFVPQPEKLPFEPAVVSREIYDEIMNRPERKAFHYLVGYENIKTIAWSPARKKIILLYNCC